MDVADQRAIDTALIELDGTANKARLGANAILGASIACLRAAAEGSLWYHIAGSGPSSLPVPQMNILNGGAHATSNVDVQEFMVVPHGFDNFPEALRSGVETYHALKSVLKEEGLLGGVGDEGGFAPNLPRNEDGLRYVLDAIERAGYAPGDQISIALDVAAQEFCQGDGYHMDGQVLSGTELGDIYSEWLDSYPIVSIEDPFGEDDWESWIEFTEREGRRVQIVGDDLYVTNPDRLLRGIDLGATNAILVKLNQIGTVTETIEVIRMARDAGFGTVISHRSGETSDDVIADIAVGTDAGQIKTGAPARSDRTAKYNQLLRIAEQVDAYTDLF
jgi:enolase